MGVDFRDKILEHIVNPNQLKYSVASFTNVFNKEYKELERYIYAISIHKIDGNDIIRIDKSGHNEDALIVKISRTIYTEYFLEQGVFTAIEKEKQLEITKKERETNLVKIAQISGLVVGLYYLIQILKEVAQCISHFCCY